MGGALESVTHVPMDQEPPMTFRAPIFALLAAVLCLPFPAVFAQTLCGGFNHLTNQENSLNLTTGNWVAVLFVPQTTVQIDRLQFRFFAGTGGGGVVQINSSSGRMQVRSADPATGLPSSNVLASQTFGVTAGGALSLGTGWRGATFQSPVILVQGGTYYLVYDKSTAGTARLGVENNPPGPDATPFSTSTDGVTWTSISTTNRFKIRLRDTSGSQCVPSGPSADVTLLGSGCAGSGPMAPTLTTNGLPVLGNSTFGFTIDAGAAAANVPYDLFWSVGGNPAGTPLAGGCVIHLELTSTVALINQGLNPIASGTLGPLGQVNVPFGVPSDPNLAGAQFAFQTLILAPFGVPTGAPGVNYVLSDAILLTLGY